MALVFQNGLTGSLFMNDLMAYMQTCCIFTMLQPLILKLEKPIKTFLSH